MNFVRWGVVHLSTSQTLSWSLGLSKSNASPRFSAGAKLTIPLHAVSLISVSESRSHGASTSAYFSGGVISSMNSNAAYLTSRAESLSSTGARL
eukprot:656264-Amphidinium_carterae.1